MQAQQHQQRVAFASLEALVYALVAAPWTVPDLDIERDLDALLALEAALATTDGLVLTEALDLIEVICP